MNAYEALARDGVLECGAPGMRAWEPVHMAEGRGGQPIELSRGEQDERAETQRLLQLWQEQSGPV